MQTGIVLLVCSGLCWVAIGAVISSAARRGLNLNRIQADSALFCLLTGLAVLLFLGNPAGLLPPRLICGLLLGSSVMNYLTFLLMQRAMRHGHHGVVWSVVQSACIWPFLMGVTVFGVGVTWCRAGGALLVIAGVAFAGAVQKRGSSADSGLSAWGFMFAAFAAAGLSQCLANLPSYLNGGNFSSVGKTIASQAGILLAFAAAAAVRKSVGRGAVSWSHVAILSAATLLAQFFFFYRGLDLVAQEGAGAVGYPIVLSSCIAGFFLYSALVIRERITFFSVCSVICCLGGIILLAL